MRKQQVSILGATGSIGLSTLKVIDLHRDRYSVYALSANSNVDLMVTLVEKYQPVYAVMADEQAADILKASLSGHDTEVLSGLEGLKQIAADESVDTVMASIVGAAGLLPTLAAVYAGKRILFANKRRWSWRAHSLCRPLQSVEPRCYPLTVSTMQFFNVCPLK